MPKHHVVQISAEDKHANQLASAWISITSHSTMSVRYVKYNANKCKGARQLETESMPWELYTYPLQAHQEHVCPTVIHIQLYNLDTNVQLRGKDWLVWFFDRFLPEEKSSTTLQANMTYGYPL